MIDADFSDDETPTERVYTRTWYGRGEPISAKDVEVRIRQAFAIAAGQWPMVFMGADEDAHFQRDADAYTVHHVTTVEQAMEWWWNFYGSAETHDHLIEYGFGPWIEKFGPGMMEG